MSHQNFKLYKLKSIFYSLNNSFNKTLLKLYSNSSIRIQLLKTFVDVSAYDFILSKCKTCKINNLQDFVLMIMMTVCHRQGIDIGFLLRVQYFDKDTE